MKRVVKIPPGATPFDSTFRAMILGERLTPLSRLSSAFLAPKTPLDLQFAYFESALAVDFLVERFGLPALKGLLDDLGAGISINESLPHRTKMSLDQIDREFAQFARQRAEKVAPGATWEEPDAAGRRQFGGRDGVAREASPELSRACGVWAARLVVEEKWAESQGRSRTLKALYPEYVGPDNAVSAAGDCFPAIVRSSRRTQGPRGAGDAGRRRDHGLSAADGARPRRPATGAGVAKNARRFLAVNPLVPTPHRQLARAAEHLGERDDALTAYRAVALLDDTDPAEVHYHLAKLLRDAGKPQEARREVLRSLEEAPRFRDAHQLLLELVEHETVSRPSPRPAASSPR